MIISFCTLQTAGSVDFKIAARREKLNSLSTANKKLGYQPQIIIVGNRENPHSFIMFFEGIKYSFDTFLNALDCTFKTTFVFNANYSVDCEPVWLFIQKNIYNINLANDKSTLSLRAASAAFKTS